MCGILLKNVMKRAILFLLLLLITSCGVTVHYDYDKEVNFTSYKTYQFYQDIDSGLNELDDKRVITIIDSILQNNGFVKSQTPVFLINFYAKEGMIHSRNTIGIGIGGGGGNVGYGISGGIPIGRKSIDQQFTVDFIDVKQDRLIWQGVVDGAIKEKASPQWKEAYYKKIISKLLKGFPPN